MTLLVRCSWSGVINLETDNSLQPKVTIPIFGEIIGDITIYPKKIYYGSVKKGEGIVQKIFVKINKENIEISGVKVTPDYLSARILKNSKRSKESTCKAGGFGVTPIRG